MAKKFLTRQDENIEEYAIDIKEESPVSPVTNQSYVDKTDLQIKLSTSSKDFILSERSRTKQSELAVNNIFIKDAEIFIADLTTFTPYGSYSVSTIFDNRLSEEISYTKDGDTLTFSMWIKVPLAPLDSVSEKIIFSYPKEDFANALSLYIKNGDLILEKNSNNISYAFTKNQWTHVTGVYNDVTGLVLYINGEQIGTAVASGALASSGTIILTSNIAPADASAAGSNAYGQLGIGSMQVEHSDELVAESDFIAISAGTSHSLALKADGRVFSWGRNDLAALGDNTIVNKSSPIQVIGQSDFVAISTGAHSLALKSDGRVYSWGNGTNGELGDNTIINKSSPVQVVGQSDFVAISAGLFHSLALKADGRVFSWGYNFYSQLGDNTAASKSSPVQVIGQSDFVAVSGDGYHSLALKADGRVYSWGYNADGQLGDSTVISKSSPIQVIGQSDFVAISAGAWHSLALKADGRVFAWGSNASGELGDGTGFNMYSPTLVANESDFVAISAGANFSLALKADGRVFAWGVIQNATNTVLPSPNSLIPVDMSYYYVSNAAFISAGAEHSLFLETPTNWSGRISNLEVWNKNLTIDSFLLYKRGYQKSPSFITYPTGLQHQYLMGDGSYYNINFDYLNLENKNVKLLINNPTLSPSVVNFLTNGSEEKISNILPTASPVENYIKNGSKRIVDVSSTNGIITTNYKDTDLNNTYINKDETESQDAVLNKRPAYSLDIPEAPVLSLSAVFDNTNYYTVQTATLPVPGTSLSISCWVKMNSSDTTQQIFKYGDFEFFLNGTTLTLKKGTLIAGTGTFDLSNPANQGWNHFVATWSYAGPGTGDLYVYRNGVQVIGQLGQNDDGGFGTAPSGVVNIGANPGDSNFRLSGKMANFEIWHAKLTQADSALLYGSGYYKNPSAIVLKTLALHYLMGDYLMDTYLELNSMTLNDIKALATGVILFDKNDIP